MGATLLHIAGGTVITPQGPVRNGTVTVRGTRIASVGKKRSAVSAAKKIDAAGGYVVPGFIDTHVHGGAGYDCISGLFSAKRAQWDRSAAACENAVPAIARFHAAHGTTALAVATTAAPEKSLLAALERIGRCATDGVTNGARILGAHVEGSFLKSPAFAGAQSPEHFLKPSASLLNKMLSAAGGAISIVNVAPEYGRSACSFIEKLTAQGGVAGIGHTGCTFRQYQNAVDAGARLHIHLGNGPTETSFKAPGRALEAALTDDRVTGELIMDGYHLNPAYVLDFLLAKDFNAVGITDCMFAAGKPGIKRFKLGTKYGEVDRNGERLTVAGSTDALFGSTLTMDRAFRNCVAWLSAGMRGVYHRTPVMFSRDMAVAAAVQLFSTNPARLLGVWKQAGSVSAGKRADLVVLDSSMNVTNVIINGKKVLR